MKNYLKLFSATSIWAFFNGYLLKSLSFHRENNSQASATAFGMYTAVVGGTLSVIQFLRDYIIEKKNPFTGLTPKQIAALAGLGIFAGTNNVFQYTAIMMDKVANGGNVSKVANVALVHSLAFPISIVFLVLLLKEKLRVPHVLAIAAGFLGAAIIAWKDGRVDFAPWLQYTLISAVCCSGEIFFSTYLGDGHLNVPGRISTFAKLGFQIPTMYVGSRILGQSLALNNGVAIAKVVVGGFLLYVSFVLVFTALGKREEGKVPGSIFSVIGYNERICTVAIGALIWHEELTRNMYIGGLLILVAEALVIIGRGKKQPAG